MMDAWQAAQAQSGALYRSRFPACPCGVCALGRGKALNEQQVAQVVSYIINVLWSYVVVAAIGIGELVDGAGRRVAWGALPLVGWLQAGRSPSPSLPLPPLPASHPAPASHHVHLLPQRRKPASAPPAPTAPPACSAPAPPATPPASSPSA